jgi:hypothetical protein
MTYKIPVLVSITPTQPGLWTEDVLGTTDSRNKPVMFLIKFSLSNCGSDF